MEKNLTKSQSEVISEILKKGNDKVILIGPPGSGKAYITRFFANVLKMNICFIISDSDMDMEGFDRYYLPPMRDKIF